MTVYFTIDSNNIVNHISGLVSVIDTAVTDAAALSDPITLTKQSIATMPDWVVPYKATFNTTNSTFTQIAGITINEVEQALHAFLDQCDQWDIGLVVYGGTIQSFGHSALNAGRQGAIDYAEDTNYTLAIREKGLKNMALGASDITSPSVLAQQIDQFSSQGSAPSTKIIWVNRATGERITLAAAVGAGFGTLDANFKEYTRPTVVA